MFFSTATGGIKKKLIYSNCNLFKRKVFIQLFMRIVTRSVVLKVNLPQFQTSRAKNNFLLTFQTVQRLRDAFLSGKTRSLEWRRSQLKAFVKLIDENIGELHSALSSDLRRVLKKEKQTSIYHISFTFFSFKWLMQVCFNYRANMKTLFWISILPETKPCSRWITWKIGRRLTRYWVSIRSLNICQHFIIIHNHCSNIT